MAGNVVAVYKTFVNSLSEAKDAAYVFRDPRAVVSQIDKIRQQVLGNGSTANKHKVQNSCSTSTPRSSRRQCGGLSPILPDATVRLIPGHKKVWQDELRFVLGLCLKCGTTSISAISEASSCCATTTQATTTRWRSPAWPARRKCSRSMLRPMLN